MPMYEYQCKKCGQRTEIIQKFSDAPLTTCSACKGTLEKLISPAGLQFKGSGWYVTDYARKPGPGKESGDEKERPAKPPESTSTPAAKDGGTPTPPAKKKPDSSS